MYYDNGSVYVEKNDQCITCKNFVKGVACPLLQALAMGIVTLEGLMYVTNCGFYEEFVRHLKLVSENDDEKVGLEEADKKNPKNPD